MRVEFTVDEAVAMTGAVLDGLAGAGLGRADAAALRRWRNREAVPASPWMQALTEAINRELQGVQESARSSGIVKPDWA